MSSTEVVTQATALGLEARRCMKGKCRERRNGSHWNGQRDVSTLIEPQVRVHFSYHASVASAAGLLDALDP